MDFRGAGGLRRTKKSTSAWFERSHQRPIETPLHHLAHSHLFLRQTLYGLCIRKASTKLGIQCPSKAGIISDRGAGASHHRNPRRRERIGPEWHAIVGIAIRTDLPQVLQNLANLLGIPRLLNFAVMFFDVLSHQVQNARRPNRQPGLRTRASRGGDGVL